MTVTLSVRGVGTQTIGTDAHHRARMMNKIRGAGVDVTVKGPEAVTAPKEENTTVMLTSVTAIIVNLVTRTSRLLISNPLEAIIEEETIVTRKKEK